MSNEQATAKSETKFDIRQMALIGLMTAVICVLAPFSISIPVSPVPISLATFAVCITTYIIGLKRGVLCTFLYLLLGLVGLPVFSGFSSGPGKLFGPTGGYLVGYLFLALICGYIVDKFRSKLWLHFIGMIAGVAACYLFGTVWLAYLKHLSFAAALAAGVIPFIPGDIAKIIIVMIIGPQLYKALNKAHLL